MTPLLFGPAHRRLYGVYHPAASPGRGVVLVPPLGQEALRAHRAIRSWAAALADAGWHVLRFDPYGTGDSAGDELDVRLPGMIEDARTAVGELAAVSGARQIVLGGLRLGATVALMAARGAVSVRGLMLWEPVVTGGLIRRAADESQQWHEIEGFRHSAALCLDLRAISEELLLNADGALPKRGILALSGGAPAMDGFATRLSTRVEKLEVYSQPGPTAWTEENDFGAGPIPAGAIAALSGWRG